MGACALVSVVLVGCSDHASTKTAAAADSGAPAVMASYESARDALVQASNPCLDANKKFIDAGQALLEGTGEQSALKDALDSAAFACGKSADQMEALKASNPIPPSDQHDGWNFIIGDCRASMVGAKQAFDRMSDMAEASMNAGQKMLKDATQKQAACNAEIDHFAKLLEASPKLDKAAAPAPPPAPFQASFIPAVSGDGNFEICLKKEISGDPDFKPFTIPANIVFQSWGQLVKDLRESQNNEDRAIGGDLRDPAVKELTSYAVVTTKPVSLSRAHECVKTTVRAATSDGFVWMHTRAPASKHYVFAPYPNVLKGRFILSQQWGSSTTDKPDGPSRGGIAGDAIAEEYFSGALVADAGDPVRLLEEP
jgi:hypothetical protein